MPRLAPITTKSQLPAEHHHVADKVLKVFGHIRGPFSMLLHSPQLAEQLLPMVTFVREDIVVETRPRFAAILTAARERECRYVWAAQVEQARKHEIGEDLIDLVRSRADLDRFPADVRDVVSYARELLRTNRVDQKTFDTLRNTHGERWMVELTAAMNFFGFVSGIANAFEIDPPAGGDKF
jgi:4-carboxymuconolactone decarboxylase